MIKRLALVGALLAPLAAHAYTAQDLLKDCHAAEDFYTEKKAGDPYTSLQSGRCISYVAGFADGYAVSDFLTAKIGVRIGAFCLPKDPDLMQRMVRAVVIHVERTPPTTTASTATLVAGALAKAFPCNDTLEGKK